MDPARATHSLLADSLRAHALLFTRPLAPVYPAAAGNRILLAFVAVAFVVFMPLRLALGGVGERNLPLAKLGFVLTLCAAFFLLQRAFVRLPFADVGLLRLPEWTRLEHLYLFQVAPLAALAFAFVFREHLLGLLQQYGIGGFAVFAVLTGVLWGMAQELLHRGWLQTELTRRFGGTVGLLAANAVFTFGPLHFDHFTDPAGVRWGGLVAVFAIGLFFGLLYRRSGNLWLPAILHGLWPLNMS